MESLLEGRFAARQSGTSIGSGLGFLEHRRQFRRGPDDWRQIPGRTRVMSTAIFDYVETMQWREANILAGGMVVFAFVVILSMILIQKRYARAGA